MIACSCDVCTSTDPRNHRTRTSAVISNGASNILIDTTPELRLQAVAAGLCRLDAVLLTHAHADHIFGLDDIRRFNDIQGCAIPCYGRADTLESVRVAFDYVFASTQEGGGLPRIKLRPVSGPFEVAGMTIRPIPVFHGEMPIFGYRIGNLAYLTDCSRIPEESLELLTDLDMLVLGALRPKPHPTHFTIDQAVEVALRLSAKKTYFVHMSHRVDYEKTNSSLPVGIELAYDGLRVEV